VASTVEELAEDIIDDGRESFTFTEADGLAELLKVTTAKVIRELRSYGLAYEGRPAEKRVRGFTSSSHDRYFGPGSSPMHGGSGWEQINGFGGQE
jgi:hypothetical protein